MFLPMGPIVVVTGQGIRVWTPCGPPVLHTPKKRKKRKAKK